MLYLGNVSGDQGLQPVREMTVGHPEPFERASQGRLVGRGLPFGGSGSHVPKGWQQERGHEAMMDHHGFEGVSPTCAPDKSPLGAPSFSFGRSSLQRTAA